jgi:hypothetical protein
MNVVSYLFSGDDVSGRDLLLTRSTSRKLEGVLGRTAAAVAITLTAIVISPAEPPLAVGRAAGTTGAEIDVSDTLLERVWKARSDGIQPNTKSREHASAVLDEFRESGIEPDRVVADRDGGVAIYVFGRREVAPGAHARHARILAANEGDLIALCVDYEHDTRDAWEAKLGELEPTISRVRAFVAG